MRRTFTPGQFVYSQSGNHGFRILSRGSRYLWLTPIAQFNTAPRRALLTEGDLAEYFDVGRDDCAVA